MSTKTCYNRFTTLETTTIKGEMVDALPSAVTAEERGMVYLLKGAAGAADTLHVCIKNAAGTYELKTVTLT
ncbi:MAG: hypothetical protein ACOX2Z_00110 [Minisyncoccales bacterium]|jgi:hypothetical protein